MKDVLKTPRLHVQDALGAGGHVALSPEQSHYILHVMRLKTGDVVRLFNGRDGEWRAEAGVNKKRAVDVMVNERLKPQKTEPNLRLCCAPLKRAHFDFMIMKATELGVARIQPVLTARAQIREVNVGRCLSIAIEAAEQSERLNVPEIKVPLTLDFLIKNWPRERLPIVCAEFGEATPIAQALQQPDIKAFSQAAVVTGPEGGFAPEELERLRQMPHALPVRLGPRILRADTAALAALACWQAHGGDWRDF